MVEGPDLDDLIQHYQQVLFEKINENAVASKTEIIDKLSNATNNPSNYSINDTL